ncbi:MAG: hypothetical protein HFF87_01035 [Oscillibacter sp.]|jgi:beta-lactamase regulating signal transducer with metallopeptidase domain|nr:hypothetical protein [Oscillibacter sp.]
MNALWKVFLSMSLSGSLLILVLFLGKHFWKDKISRQWQYYIWLAAVLRLLLPFGPESNLLGKTYQAIDRTLTQTASSPAPQLPPETSDRVQTPAAGLEGGRETVNRPAENRTSGNPLQDLGTGFAGYIRLLWLAGALGMLIRKTTVYQGFTRYIRAGLTPVSDIEMLDRLSILAEQAGMKGPVELCINPLISSPLLIGFFHPCIVLPSADIPGKDFQFIALHELIHYKRRDMFYKWLVQAAVCLHWFNPLVHLMSREIANACEFSCDEAVLTKMGGGSAQDYGKTLLDAMAAVGKYKEPLGTVTLSENKQLLKERLGAIMNFRKKSVPVRLFTGALTLCMILGAAFVGVYPVSATSDQTAGKPSMLYQKGKGAVPAPKEPNTSNKYALMAERYYAADSLPLFQMAFLYLDEDAQSKWLERIYAGRKTAFLSAVVNLLDEDCAQILHLAETAYENDDISAFSVLAMHMSDETLEVWLDKALEDGKWAFQSVLFDAMDLGCEFDELEEKREKEWAEAQMAEYRAAGVTMDGKDYYYKGELVRIFLDIRPNKSFYTLNMNPKGTVNIKIVRNEKNEITGVAYMTEEEVTELFGDSEDDPDVKFIPVNFKTVRAGEAICLGEYTLSEGDKIWYDISVETGKRIQVYFAKDEQKNVAYWSVNNLRQPGKPLNCIADFTVGPPATEAGTYRLYLQAPDGSLGNVKGSILIEFADKS